MTGVRRVRTPEGARRYRLPIGAPIVARPGVDAWASFSQAVRAAGVGADLDDRRFRERFTALVGRLPPPDRRRLAEAFGRVRTGEQLGVVLCGLVRGASTGRLPNLLQSLDSVDDEKRRGYVWFGPVSVPLTPSAAAVLLGLPPGSPVIPTYGKSDADRRIDLDAVAAVPGSLADLDVADLDRFWHQDVVEWILADARNLRSLADGGGTWADVDGLVHTSARYRLDPSSLNSILESGVPLGKAVDAVERALTGRPGKVVGVRALLSALATGPRRPEIWEADLFVRLVDVLAAVDKDHREDVAGSLIRLVQGLPEDDLDVVLDWAARTVAAGGLLDGPSSGVTSKGSYAILLNTFLRAAPGKAQRTIDLFNRIVRARWYPPSQDEWPDLVDVDPELLKRVVASPWGPMLEAQNGLAWVAAMQRLGSRDRDRAVSLPKVGIEAAIRVAERSGRSLDSRGAALRTIVDLAPLVLRDHTPTERDLMVEIAMDAVVGGPWPLHEVQDFVDTVRTSGFTLSDRATGVATLWRSDRAAVEDAVALVRGTVFGRRFNSVVLSWAAVTSPETRRAAVDVVTHPPEGADASDLRIVVMLAGDDPEAVRTAADMLARGWSRAAAGWIARHRDRLARLSGPPDPDRPEDMAVLSLSDGEWERYRSERDSGADHLAAWRKVLGAPVIDAPVTSTPPEGRQVRQDLPDWQANRTATKAATARLLAPSVADPGPLDAWVDGPPVGDLFGPHALVYPALAEAHPDRVRFPPRTDWTDAELARGVVLLPDGKTVPPSPGDDLEPIGDRTAVRTAARVVDNWSTTANDENPLALAIQERARELFGLEGTMDWQMSDSLRRGVRRAVAEAGPWIDRLLVAMWRATQERYGPDTVFHVWRGWRHEPELSGPAPPAGEDVAFALRPLSSWSASWEVAVRFAGYVSRNSRLAEAFVPVERVLCTANGTGFGCLPEREFVVLGGPTRAAVQRVR